MVFVRPGTYLVEGIKQQKTAFSKGTLYFRHGAKSEPGNSDDIRQVIERNLEITRRQWLDGVQRVVSAPYGSEVVVWHEEFKQSSSPQAIPIRVVEDSSAPRFGVVDRDLTHPHRQKEVIDKINEALPDGIRVNSYDVLIARKTHRLDQSIKYCYRPKFGSPQYSDAFATWFLDRYAEDSKFFVKARAAHHKAGR